MSPRVLTLNAAKRLAVHHGMRVERLGPQEPLWTGQVINMTRLMEGNRDAWGRPKGPLYVPRRILHEVGHYLIAPDERRCVINYGHGYGLLRHGSALIEWDEREEEDALAMLMAVALEGALISSEAAIDALNHQGWTWTGGWTGRDDARAEQVGEIFWKGVARLNEAGLLIGGVAAPELVPHHHRRALRAEARAA